MPRYAVHLRRARGLIRKKYGIVTEQDIQLIREVTDWLDATHLNGGDFTHRIAKHHVKGLQEVEEKFGEKVANLVDEATATKRNYFPNLKTIEGVILLTASRLCNMANMDDWSEEKKQEYVFKKTKYWLP